MCPAEIVVGDVVRIIGFTNCIQMRILLCVDIANSIVMSTSKLFFFAFKFQNNSSKNASVIDMLFLNI